MSRPTEVEHAIRDLDRAVVRLFRDLRDEHVEIGSATENFIGSLRIVLTEVYDAGFSTGYAEGGSAARTDHWIADSLTRDLVPPEEADCV